MNKYTQKIAITLGDPNGIGAEIVIKALNSMDINPSEFVIVGNKGLLDVNGHLRKNIELIDIPYIGSYNLGKDTKEGGDFSFRQLETACKISPRRIVTAPVSKKAMHLAGHYFNGQTEVLEHFLAKNNEKAEMLFLNNDFRVLLLTRHVSLREIVITKELVYSKVKRLVNFFRKHTNIQNPRIALCALNPHAGENGVLGNEEIEILNPAVEKLAFEGINIEGAYSADTLLAEALRCSILKTKQPYDCYVAMYHDQGLIPIKAAGTSSTVNMTIGLDIIRTSPAHGTAFDIAGKGIASEKSMVAAIEAALHI